jgi:hypothetical protein
MGLAASLTIVSRLNFTTAFLIALMTISTVMIPITLDRLDELRTQQAA